MKKFPPLAGLVILSSLTACKKESADQDPSVPEVVRLTCGQKLVSFDTNDHNRQMHKVLTRPMKATEQPEEYLYHADDFNQGSDTYLRIVENHCPTHVGTADSATR